MATIDDEPRAYFEPSPKVTWCDRLRRKLFQYRHCSRPDAPGVYKDCVSVRTVSVLSWCDRIRVLLTGIVVVQSKTVTENEVGDSVTNAVLYVGTKRDLKA